VEPLSDDARLMSVTYIGPKSRTERPRTTKIDTEVAHVTHDSYTTFKVKGQLAGGGGILWRPPAQLVSNAFSSANNSVITIEYTGQNISMVTINIIMFVSSALG